MKSKRCASSNRPRLKPLALSLALALALGTSLAGAVRASMPADVLAEQRRGADPNGQSHYPAGHPRAALIDMIKARTPPNRPAGVVAVSNCSNAGPGSLRNAIETAVSGDVVDLGDLACSTITLTTGALVAAVDDISIVGPEAGGLMVSGNDTSQVVLHLGQGTLTISDLVVAHGHKYGGGPDDAHGGCIYSAGAVIFNRSTAKYCTARTGGSGQARGGAIHAAESVLLADSLVTGNEVIVNNGFATGAGVHTPGSFVSQYSTLRENAALGLGNGRGMGGAAFVRGGVSIMRSTVSGNIADLVGGMNLPGANATDPLSIRDSTISGNESLSSFAGAGLYLGRDTTIANSTITGNVERNSSNTKYGGGLTLGGGVTATLQSTIVSGNTLSTEAGSLPSDIGEVAGAALAGANNVLGYVGLAPPPGTIISTQPMLGPLASNGGATQTHRLLKRSPAINAGNNVFGVPTDQRGPGFDREVGAGADAGAFESDTLFYSGVEAQ